MGNFLLEKNNNNNNTYRKKKQFALKDFLHCQVLKKKKKKFSSVV